MSIDDKGQVVYKLEKPWGRSGATESRLLPRDFLRRLAMLIPPPYQNLIRHWGVFASRSKLRPLLPPPPPVAPLEPPKLAAAEDMLDEDQDMLDEDHHASPSLPQRTYRLPWAQLMKRVLGLDPLTCKRCSTPMVILAFISDLEVVRKILDHLKIPTDVVPAPLAHGPWPSQTVMEVLKLEPERDHTANSSASCAKLETATRGARGPPLC